ncbi:MAG: branched-chain amino acid ABC transporter permease [Candidimonas sp.]|uniref:Branched-chain amino acid ABC transporter permease n=2 Tax=Pollutimonas thiosulfatoxidans TaxID=2028345 RepID=A0A410GCJ9_9BURK|nr:branched-chain amino acid ABC transporter permease [Candidimonas sp.]NYT44456.1 branched-chain amino acid ABC transporter permease [Alcaligenaceae bacterium]QAA94005.1 branched-chain amino acid ABC transporter permease [Pollutimonas thiosulfatoxidans]
MPSLGLFMSQVFNGLALGVLLSLIAAGLTIIYGTLGVINFAHGALFVVGAYAGFSIFTVTDSFTISIIGGAVAAMLVGLIMERGLIKRFYNRPVEDQILVTFGVSIVIVEIVRAIFGGVGQRVPIPTWGEGVVDMGFVVYPLYRIQILGIAAAALFLCWLVLYRTRLGLIIRSGIEDALMTRLLGINIQRAFLVVFGVGAAAAGFAGVIYGPIVSIVPDMGFRVLIQSFVVVVLGGVGSFPGAILGGLIAGQILSLTSLFNPVYSDVMLFAAMALVLILRPQGLLGVEGRA